jgi:TRAP-type C4-dicarboxylate transport system substrate-binding protein
MKGESMITRILVALLLIALVQAAAAEQVKIRLGALAPRGTAWHRTLLEMGEKWRAAEGAGAEFVVYGGGSQGGEADMVRRMRVGQLNAAMLSVIGLTEIDPSVSALQKMPLMFRSWDELDYVREKLRPALEKRFHDAGFVVLCWGDAGWVRFFSRTPALRPDDFRRLKIFAWSGDAPQADIMKSLGYQPVVLEVADILPGLQTGMINMVPSTPFWALTLQFYPHASYMLELDWAPMVGAIIVTRKAWDAMSSAGRQALTQAGAEAGIELRALSRREHQESVAAMEKRGLKVQRLTPELDAEWRRAAEQMYPLVRGKMVPAEFFDEVQRLLREYRAARQARAL